MVRIDRFRNTLAGASVGLGLLALGLFMYVATYARANQFHYGCPGAQQPWGLFVGGLVCAGVAVMIGAVAASWPRREAERGWGRLQLGTTLVWIGLILVDTLVGLAALFWLIQMQCGLD